MSKIVIYNQLNKIKAIAKRKSFKNKAYAKELIAAIDESMLELSIELLEEIEEREDYDYFMDVSDYA